MGIYLLICKNFLLGVVSFSFLLVGFVCFCVGLGCRAAFDCVESKFNVF